MKFVFKFINTPELREFYDDIYSLMNNVKDAETFIEGALLGLFIIVAYFVFLVAAI